jgi:hypothetical protein
VSVRLCLGVTLTALLAVPTVLGCSGSKNASPAKPAAATTTQHGEPTTTAAPEVDPMAGAQACVDAWNAEKDNPALASFLLASGGRRGLKRVSVGFATGDACLISFAGTNGFVVQVIEVDPPSGQFTGLFPPARLDKFDPRPVGWNASANADGYLLLRHPGADTPLHTVVSDETTAFPDELEDEVLAVTPSDGWQCQRSGERTEGAVAGVLCDPTPQISVRYELYSSLGEVDAAYWRYFDANAEAEVTRGGNCVRGAFGEGWFTQPGKESGGRLFCFRDTNDRPALVWKDDATHVLAFASGRDRAELVDWWRSGGGAISVD